MSDYNIKVEERIGSILISGHQEESGVLHGAYVWKENGRLVAQGFFQYGSPHGLWVYYKEGQVIGEKYGTMVISKDLLPIKMENLNL